jgi:hypothetical protein
MAWHLQRKIAVFCLFRAVLPAARVDMAWQPENHVVLNKAQDAL